MIALLLALLVMPAQAERPALGLLQPDAPPGTPSQHLEVVVRALAAGLQAEGRVLPFYGPDLARRGVPDAEERLAAARNAFAEGRQLLLEGDPELAAVFLEEATSRHEEAGSATARPGEVADAHFTFARALLAAGDRERAEHELLRAIRLVPDYLATRADTADPALMVVAARASARLADRPPRALSARQAADLSVALRVDCLVHGAVQEDGSLVLTLHKQGELRHTLSRPGPFRPPPPGHASWRPITLQLAEACLGLPITAQRLQPERRPPSRQATVETAPPPSQGAANDLPPQEQPPRQPPRRAGWVVWSAAGLLTAGAAVAVIATWPDNAPPAPTWTLIIE